MESCTDPIFDLYILGATTTRLVYLKAAYVHSCRVMEGFTDEIIKQRAIYAWEYGVYRGIVNPPQFLANGVMVPDGETFNVDQWVDFINNLFDSPY